MALNLMFTIFSFSLLLARYNASYMLAYIYFGSATLLTFKSLILVWAICRFNSFIKSIKVYAMPNRKLMVCHFINVAIYTVSLAMGSALYVQALRSESSDGPEKSDKYWISLSILTCL